MNAIVSNQRTLQTMYSTMEGYPLLNPADFSKYTVGEVYDFIRHMKFCLEEELTELMEAMGDGTRDIHKPWSKKYFELRGRKMETNDRLKEEAIDALCFLMNILIAVGINEYNINEEYMKVLQKNLGRIEKYNDTIRASRESR